MYLLKFIVILGTAFFGILGSISDFKSKGGSITTIGKISIGGIILLSVMSFFLELSSDKESLNRYEETIDQITGGDSYCFLRLSIQDDVALPVLFVEGKHPMHDVSIRIIDATNYPESSLIKNDIQDGTFESYRRDIDFLKPGLAHGLQKDFKINLSNSDKYYYNIEFFARNKNLVQNMKLAKNDGKWFVATRLYDKSEKKVIFEKVDKSYPKLNDEEINWMQAD